MSMTANLTSFYGLICLSIVISILVAGLAVAPAYKYYEKKDDPETARKKSLAIAMLIWILVQVAVCLLIFSFNQQFLL